MAAKIKLDWSYLEFRAANVTSWTSLKREVDLNEYPTLFSNRAVYVFRISRPFAFLYENGLYSPVAYIGKGQAQQRIAAHVKTWVPQLSRKIPDLKIQIYFCEPRAPRVGRNCEGVEADLIQEFVAVYGKRPLRNRNTPSDKHDRSYDAHDLRVLHAMKGGGYHWGLTPLPSSHFYNQ
jgi:hypothetical protein